MVVAAPDQPFRHQGAFLQELNHRINNEFASAISMVALAAARSENEEVKVALDRVTKLLHCYVDIHHALQMPKHDERVDAAEYLRKLCLSISRGKLDPMRIKLLLVANPLPLEAKRCWLLGMIVNELITNAARHAFGGRSGQIVVELLQAPSHIACKVRDDGSAAETIYPGRGLKIIEELTKSLEGSFIQRFGEHGSASVVAFPYD